MFWDDHKATGEELSNKLVTNNRRLRQGAAVTAVRQRFAHVPAVFDTHRHTSGNHSEQILQPRERLEHVVASD